MPRLLPFLALTLLAGAAQAADKAPTVSPNAPEYMMPWETAPKKEVVIDDAQPLSEVILPVGKMEILKLPGAGRTVISSHPEVADLHIENPNLLFVFARMVGQTVAVVADAKLNPIYQVQVRVVRPEDMQE